MSESGCDYCDVPHTAKTYDNQMLTPVLGRVVGIDHCIGRIVAALNAGGVFTTSSCCGHGVMNGSITLMDGRTLIILSTTPESMEEWGKVVEPKLCDTQESNDRTHQPGCSP